MSAVAANHHPPQLVIECLYQTDNVAIQFIIEDAFFACAFR
jgi:hypothetical protein